ncbi:MAG TPA: hypothetical protein VFW59_08595 [Gallionella sp.]|nr:hypothetical protein [Gallionella sp.]
MKFVPSLPPPRITGVGGGLKVNRLTAVGAVRPVQPRTLPPLVLLPHEVHEPPEVERRHDRPEQVERRKYCRRVQHRPVLVEFRSGLDRRHRSQREGDPTEHVDIEV